MKTIFLSLLAILAVLTIVPALAQVDSAHTTDSISITVQHKSSPSKPVDSSITTDEVSTKVTGTILKAPVETAKASDTVTSTKIPAIDWQLIANHPSERFFYLPAQNAVNPLIPSNYYMDIVMPDGAKLNGLILSYTDFQQLKNNVAIMWVGNIHTTTAVTTLPYCIVAQFTWDHEDGYAYKVAGMKNLVIPDSCSNGVVVPEFGPVASLVLIIAVLSIVIFAAKTRVVPRF